METIPQQHIGFLEKRLRQAISNLFGEMDETTYGKVRPYFEWVDLHGGDFLFRQGNVGDSLYILASGRLKVQVLRDGSHESINEIAPGETVGEMALITGEARSADILAMRDCILARLKKPNFEALIQEYPMAMLNISKSIIERLRRLQDKPDMKKKITNLCLFPITDRVDYVQFAQQIASSLQAHGSVLMLSSLEVNELLGLDGIAHSAKSNSETYRQLTSWLEEQEMNHDYLVYLADEVDTEWTKRCLRQADEVMLLANSAENPSISPREAKYLFGIDKITIAAQTLILLHEADSKMPTGSQEWLKERYLAWHHHVRKENMEDIARIARFVSGNAVGLVLSGGAARGIAHIGVFRALEEAGQKVDIVGGTSIGAVMAGLIAMKWNGEEIREKTRKVFLKNPTNDFSMLPWISIFKGKRLEKLLNEYFSNIQIEDLWLNFFCVSCNLTKTNPRIHKNGSLNQAIRASISIPGVFPPAELANELYVDGGVFNNMPVDVMNHYGIGKIIAVDLQSYRSRKEQVTPVHLKQKVPNLLFVVMESSMLSGRYLAEQYRKYVEIYFNPPLSAFGLLDWNKFDKIEEIGYKHAKEVLSLRKKTKKPLLH